MQTPIQRFVIIILLLVSCPLSLFSQEIIEEQGEAVATVYHENFVRAKRESQFKAKQKIIFKALGSLVDDSVLTRLKPLIEEKFLIEPETFIASSEVLRGEISEDSREYISNIQASVFRTSLIRLLQKLYIPLKNHPVRTKTLVLWYDPQAYFWQMPQQTLVLKALNQHFSFYALQTTEVLSLSPEQSQLLDQGKNFLFPQLTITEERQFFLDEKKLDFLQEFKILSTEASFPQLPHTTVMPQVLQNKKTDAYAVLSISPKQWSFSKENNSSAPITLTFRLYHPEDGSLLAQTKVEQTFPSSGGLESLIKDMLSQLDLRWNTTLAELANLDQDLGAPIHIKLRGVPGPQQEEHLVKTLLLNDLRWKQVKLHTIAGNYVVYSGYYLGERQKLISELRKKEDALYVLQSIAWEEGTLSLNTEWIPQVSFLEPFVPTRFMDQWFENQPKDEESSEPGVFDKKQRLPPPRPQLQVPQNQVKTTYRLPWSIPVYDHIKRRGESTMFQVLSDKTKGKIQITLDILGKTNLSPILSLYDQKRQLIERYRVDPSKTFSLEYEFAMDQFQLFILVDDEYGYVRGIIGSYQFFHYILQVTAVLETFFP
ncbi:hypothetical protein WDW89_17725 [Deltaproteobacteria bacterium TL4]